MAPRVDPRTALPAPGSSAERLLDAAERLVALEGAAVSSHRITVEPGPRNRNAIAYHFGDRKGLDRQTADLVKAAGCTHVQGDLCGPPSSTATTSSRSAPGNGTDLLTSRRPLGSGPIDIHQPARAPTWATDDAAREHVPMVRV